MYSKQRGNILFLILLAVVLFAAISYAVTSNERGQVKSASTENVQLQAAQMEQYAGLLENVIQRIMLINDCKDTQIGFDNTAWKRINSASVHGANHNPNTPSDACRVFNPLGGGLPAQTFAGSAMAGCGGGCMRAGHPRVIVLSIEGVGTSAPDLVLNIQYFPDAVCQQINSDMGNGAILPSVSYTSTLWAGSYAGVTAVIGTGSSSALFGKRTGCALWGGNVNDTQFYHVLIAR